MTPAAVFVFDAGPLSYFARAGRMDVLHDVCGDARCVVTDEVARELEQGASAYPALRAALDAEWLKRVRLASLDELGVFAEYARVLGSSRERDRGEAATLAWAELHAATAIVDDRAGVNTGRARGVPVHGTLWLVIQGLRRGRLTEPDATALVAAFLEAGQWLPFEGAEEFIPWARREFLLD